MGRAREALAARVEEANDRYGGRAGFPRGSQSILYDLAVVIRRDEERSDREARRIIALLDADPAFQEAAAGIPLLGPGELSQWFELMLRTEAMDRVLAGERMEGDEPRWAVLDEIAGWPEDGPVVRDGTTRGRLT